MEIPSRAGVCGNGRDVIGYRHVLFARNFQTYGRWSTSHCEPGPLRVILTVADRQVTQLRTQVGGSWPATDSLFILRRREPNLPRPYKAIGYPVIPAIVLVGAAAFIVSSFLGDTANTLRAVAVLVASYPVYRIVKRSWRR